jgi:hypothetical protein
MKGRQIDKAWSAPAHKGIAYVICVWELQARRPFGRHWLTIEDDTKIGLRKNRTRFCGLSLSGTRQGFLDSLLNP